MSSRRSPASSRLAACGLAAALLSGGVAAGPPPRRAPATHTVTIEGVRFVPETLRVRAGDVVVWINKDPFPHTATAKGQFDSGEIGEGRSWRLATTAKGDIRYVCTLHPSMTGTLRVE